MAGRGPQTFKKRQKEQERKERQEAKRARRLQRKDEAGQSQGADQSELSSIPNRGTSPDGEAAPFSH
jgi:hypothetical protein